MVGAGGQRRPGGAGGGEPYHHSSSRRVVIVEAVVPQPQVISFLGKEMIEAVQYVRFPSGPPPEY